MNGKHEWKVTSLSQLNTLLTPTHGGDKRNYICIDV